ncbi:MAG: hypothetical protein AABX15_01945 [Thermoproteota archaeon]|jgi:RNA-binding protein YlmH
MPDCPECIARQRKAAREQYTSSDVNLEEIFKKIEAPMKFDPVTKHFICKKCGLYATREQVGDIREKLNQRELTREDKQYDYLEWWQKSKKDKQK